MNDKRSLQPCPFCGGAAAFRWCGGVMLAECTSCGTSKGDGNASEDFEGAAAANWNTRAAPSTERAPGEALAWAVESEHSGDVRVLEIFDDGKVARFHAENNGGMVVPLYRSVPSAKRMISTSSASRIILNITARYTRKPLAFSARVEQFWRKAMATSTEEADDLSGPEQDWKRHCYEIAELWEIEERADQEERLARFHPI